jgi:hypothetical protein
MNPRAPGALLLQARLTHSFLGNREQAGKNVMRESLAQACVFGHLGLGRLYHRTGEREQAREHLATAMTMYREMGMTYWVEKAEAEMTELGG